MAKVVDWLMTAYVIVLGVIVIYDLFSKLRQVYANHFFGVFIIGLEWALLVTYMVGMVLYAKHRLTE